MEEQNTNYRQFGNTGEQISALGFGCMRFPEYEKDGKKLVDTDKVDEMLAKAYERGVNYFDTARPYHSTASEQVLRRCLTSRYPRESYVLANKLSPTFYEKEEEILPLFYDQLRVCGVDYFDFYLFHANSAVRHEKFTQTHAYDIVKQLKAEGKIRHIATSFHARAERRASSAVGASSGISGEPGVTGALPSRVPFMIRLPPWVTVP